MNKPNCMHVSTMVKGYPAKIHWGPVTGAEGYVLERRFAVGEDTLPEAFSPVFQGMPPLVEHLHRGMTWREIRAAATPYAGIRRQALPCRRVALLGEGRWERDHTWSDTFPQEADLIQYRVKAYGGGAESGYKTSGITRVLDHAPADDDLEIPVKAGELLYIVVAAEAVIRFPPAMQLHYNPAQLRLVELTGNIGQPFLVEGAAEFAYKHEIPEDMVVTGLVALLKFEARVSGTTQLVLS